MAYTEEATSDYEMEQFLAALSVSVRNFLNSYDALVARKAYLDRRGGAAAWMTTGTPGEAVEPRITSAANGIGTIQTAFDGASNLRANLEKVLDLK